jgi:predicted nuclease of restriction endonuclease-like (RecB) superfamily
MTERLDVPVEGYDDVLTEVLAEIRRAETEAVRRSNALVVELYSRVGRVILARQRDESYGSQLIDRLAVDLASRFGGRRGWSARNLRYMRAFARAWPDDEILQARLQNLSWTHHQILIDRLVHREDRLWYAEQAVSNSWSTRVLQAQIHTQLHERIGTAPSNFAVTMPQLDSEALDQLATDPYRLDFLLVDPRAREQAIELAMVDRITQFLTHLGRGFAYLGRQWRLTVGNSDFFLDLAFYNVHLHSYVIFEIKTTDFAPAHAGQLGFYVTAFERQIRRPGDGPTIGVLLVPDKDDVVVEYTLAATNMPMTVARYTYPQLPADIRSELPQASELAPILKGT